MAWYADFVEKNCLSACVMGDLGARGGKRKAENDGGVDRSAGSGAASAVVTGSWVT
jgi:hypothetical protein